MNSEEKQTSQPSSQPQKGSSVNSMRKTSFRLRQMKPAYLPSPPKLTQRPTPRNFSDYYSHQQAIAERLRNRDKKMSNTSSNFFASPVKKLSANISPPQSPRNLMRRTFYQIRHETISPPRAPTSDMPVFGKTSINFRRMNIYKDEKNENYLNKYQIIRQLGKGSFSTVFLARKIQKKDATKSYSPSKMAELNPESIKDTQQIQNTLSKSQKLVQHTELQEKAQQQTQIQDQPPKQQLVAIKVYEKFNVSKDPHKFKNIRKQVNIMQHLDNDGVLRLFESVETLTKISLVVEFGGEESLLEYVKHNYPLSIERVRDISLQLIRALAYIHDHNIVHRDIKLQNVLIHENHIKLIDFGFSCLTHKNQKLTVICGTPNYMAPEVISRKQYIGQQADIWSYGVVVYALAEGRHPFKAETYNELQRLVNRGKFQFKKVKDQLFIDFVKRILRTKPSERPSARQILQFKWLNLSS